jgi:hypothetical protein
MSDIPKENWERAFQKIVLPETVPIETDFILDIENRQAVSEPLDEKSNGNRINTNS